MHDRLRTQRLSPSQSREIYMTLAKHVHSYDEICLLLTVAPEAHGGLFYVALGLFHRDKDVRLRTSELLERISEHDAGRHWWQALSRFERLGFVRVRREAEADVRSRLAEKEGFAHSATTATAATTATMTTTASTASSSSAATGSAGGGDKRAS